MIWIRKVTFGKIHIIIINMKFKSNMKNSKCPIINKMHWKKKLENLHSVDIFIEIENLFFNLLLCIAFLSVPFLDVNCCHIIK